MCPCGASRAEQKNSLDPNKEPSPIPLTSGKMLAIYTSSGHVVRVKSWTGKAWNPTSVKTQNTISSNFFSAVAQGDDVHLVFLQTSIIRYQKYIYTTNSLGPEEIIQAGVTGSSAPVLSIDSTGNLHLFWAGSPKVNHIYYKQNSGGKWDAAPLDWIDESAEKITNNSFLSGFYNCNSEDDKGLFYLTRNSKPYNVKFTRGAAAISLIKTGPKEAFIGDTIPYQIKVKNTG